MPNAKDLVLKLRSITDGFKTDDPVRELDDLEHSLKAAGDQSTTSAREIRNAADDMNAPGFDKAASEAESTARRMQAAAEDMASGVRKGAADVDREATNIGDSMSEAGSEIGSEFVGNIAESIGSGSGSITDVVQGTLGGLTNLAASLAGPVGLAAGAAAAGIGLVFSSVKAESDKAKERVQDLIGVLDELGETTSAQAKEAIWDDWLSTMKEMPGTLRQTVQILGTAGVTQEEFKAAITGSKDAQKTVNDKLKETGTLIDENYQKTGILSDEENEYLQHWRDVAGEVDDQLTALDEVKSVHEDINTLTGDSKSKTKSWKDEIKDVRKEVDGLKGDLDSATKDRHMNVYAYVKTQGDTKVLPDPRKGNASRGGSGGYTGGY